MSQRFLNFYMIASKKECFPDIFRGVSLFCIPPSMSNGPEGIDLYLLFSLGTKATLICWTYMIEVIISYAFERIER